MKRLVVGILASLSLTTQAHDFSGSLGESVNATDYLWVNCKADGTITADKLYFQLSSESPATSLPLVSAQIAKGNAVTNVTDLANGDSQPSRGVELVTGEGMYRITLNKNRAGKMNYSFVYHCQSNSGEHAETDTLMLQDQ